jgi:DNA-binding transcriptional MocR family regulator
MKRSMSFGSRPFSITVADLTKISALGGPDSLVDQIFVLVTSAIQSRRLSVGERMPSVRQLADDCQISRDTASRAYDKLVAHGMLDSRRGSGFFVRASLMKKDPERVVPPSPFQTRDSSDHLRFLLSLLNPPQGLASRSGVGYLPEDWMDEASITAALRGAARGSQRSLARPGSSQGYLPLRDQLHLKLHDMGVNTDASNIIVTCGAADAINLIIQAYLNVPGEYVLVEQPGQFVLMNRLLANGLVFAYVPRRSDGPDLEVLRALCEEHKPRFFFCQSLMHNPTGSSMAPHVAFQLLRLAEEFDLTIIEDDAYGDLMPPSTGGTVTRLRLAPLDQLKRVIYIGSFSRTLAPGLRVGFLAANPERIKWLAMYRALHTIATSSMAERTVYRLLSEGTYRHHCDQLRARLSDVRPKVVAAARANGLEVDKEPDAGLYVWANLGTGVDAFAVAKRLLDRGHLFAPGTLFSFEHPSYMRLNIAEASRPEMAEAFALLAEEARR